VDVQTKRCSDSAQEQSGDSGGSLVSNGNLERGSNEVTEASKVEKSPCTGQVGTRRSTKSCVVPAKSSSPGKAGIECSKCTNDFGFVKCLP